MSHVVIELKEYLEIEKAYEQDAFEMNPFGPWDGYGYPGKVVRSVTTYYVANEWFFTIVAYKRSYSFVCFYLFI